MEPTHPRTNVVDPKGRDGYVLITGGAGFIGSNLARRIVSEGRSVVLLDDLSRPGVERNAQRSIDELGGRVRLVVGDTRDADLVRTLVADASAVYHLAAQVAVTTSLEAPMVDFDVNLRGTLHVLEALRDARRRGHAPPLLFTSTNKVYGSLPRVRLVEGPLRYAPADPELRACGVGETQPLDFHSPYGCSKGAADQYVLDYARSYGVRATVFRMSCIYGPRQLGTEDQGWVAHFVMRVLAGEPLTIYGDGKQVRDVLYVADLVDAMLLAERAIDEVSGQAFNVGGGPDNVLSLRELLGMLAERDAAHAPPTRTHEVAVSTVHATTGQANVTGVTSLVPARSELRFEPWRTGDQRYYVSDTSRFRALTGWQPRVSVREGLEHLRQWFTAPEREAERAGPPASTAQGASVDAQAPCASPAERAIP